jgi:hypothetical protein
MAEYEHTIGPIKPNRYGNALAKVLRAGKSAVDKVTPSVQYKDNPRFTVGDMLFGEAPEAMDDWAHGFPPWKGKGQTWTLEPEAIDIAAMPTFGAGGAAMAVGKRAPKALSKVMGREVAEEAPDISRRDFLKKAGAAGTVAAMPSLLAKTLAKDAPAVAAKTATRNVSSVTIPKIKQTLHNMLQRHIDEIWHPVRDWHPGLPDRYTNSLEHIDSLEKDLDRLGDLISPEDLVDEATGVTKAERLLKDDAIEKLYSSEELERIERFLKQVPDDVDPDTALRRVLGDPEIEYPDFSYLGNKIDYSDPISRKKGWDAYDAVQELSGDQIDLWHATGRPPKEYPKELLDYLDSGILSETGGNISSWDEVSGVILDPGSRAIYLDYYRKP